MTEESRLRQSLAAAARRLNVLGLNRGATGNLSARLGKAMLITPSGMPAEEMKAKDLVRMDFDGRARGRWQPSTEWRFHAALYKARPGFNAVVHTHSVHATALACLGRGIPPFHYMVAIAGGPEVRCAPYRLFGTEELSDAVVEAMAGRKACLLAHHGLVAAGAALAEGMKIAVELEALAEIYMKALSVAKPRHLTAQQMRLAISKFSRYGQPARPENINKPRGRPA